MVLSSLTYLTQGMNNLTYIAHSNNENIVKLMNDKSSSVSSFNDEIDMDSLFPITNDNELRALDLLFIRYLYQKLIKKSLLARVPT